MQEATLIKILGSFMNMTDEAIYAEWKYEFEFGYSGNVYRSFFMRVLEYYRFVNDDGYITPDREVFPPLKDGSEWVIEVDTRRLRVTKNGVLVHRHEVQT